MKQRPKRSLTVMKRKKMRFKQFNKGLRIIANAGQEGKKATLLWLFARLTARIKTKMATDPQEISHIEQQIVVAPAANTSTGEDWTFSLKDVSKMYNTLDSGILDGHS